MSFARSLAPRGASRPVRLLMISAEVDPYARTGGLGDVVGALGRTVAALGVDVVIVTPRYGAGVTAVPAGATWWPDTVSGGREARALGVLESRVVNDGGGSLRVCFLDHPLLFDRTGIYGDLHGVFGDNDTRFFVMSRGALAIADRLWPACDDGPGGADVVHAHDWHAAPAILLSKLAVDERRGRAKTVFTIHNLSFQGVLATDAIAQNGLDAAAFPPGALVHEGQFNLMKGAVVLAHRVTTVSPTYAREIRGSREGQGLEAVIREQSGKLVGILNGIDAERFDPKTDPVLAARYDASAPFEGKTACKRALAAEFGLGEGDGPLFASVSRLTSQKGVDLLLAVLPTLVQEGVRFVLVGAGDAEFEKALLAIGARFPGRVGARIAFDGVLARRVYGGADFFVVPSRFEPCGLTQLYAMRYGALPIVTDVGGLHDTVEPLSALRARGTGLVAASATVPDVLIACEEARWLYDDRASYRAAVVRAMERESSWREPARCYLRLYDECLTAG